ncbi:MAG: rod shape-determining protein MreD [Clostridia bacterium]
MRRFFPIILVLVTLLIDLSVVPSIAVHWAVPVFLLPTVIVLGLLLGRTRGLLYGMVGGLLVDILVGHPMGLMAILYLLIGYLAGVSGRKFQRYLLTVVLTPIVCLSIFEISIAIYQFISGQQMTFDNLVQALARIGMETLIAQLMYLLYNRLLRPTWQRYAGR